MILPYPRTGEFPDYDEEDVPDLRSYYDKLQKNLRSTVQWPDSMTLELPPTITTSDITFLSVWCRTLEVNFGHVEFPLKKQLYD